jgi:transposase
MEKEPGIVFQQNKKTGVVYAYENRPFWDSEKKQSRSTRKLLGKLDPSTGNIVPTRGRNTKESKTGTPEPSIDGEQVIKKVLDFFQLFMCVTLAKRLLSIVLIAVNVSDNLITELTGLCGQSVRALRKTLIDGDIDSLFHVGGGGRKRKLLDVEDAIIEEINSNSYHSHQQIADMIQEKYEIKVSLPVISRLLKKTNQTAKMRLAASESEPDGATRVL